MTVHKIWGYYNLMYDTPDTKVKEITLDPRGMMSMQRHKNRNEYWIVVEGSCTLDTEMKEFNMMDTIILKKHDTFTINKNEWHRLTNPSGDIPCKIIEIQYGEVCDEEDIEVLK